MTEGKTIQGPAHTFGWMRRADAEDGLRALLGKTNVCQLWEAPDGTLLRVPHGSPEPVVQIVRPPRKK